MSLRVFLKGVLGVFKCASRMYLACFTGIGRKFKAFVKDHSRVFQGCSEGILGLFLGSLMVT